MRGETGVGDAVPCRGLRERVIPVIDEQQVGSILPLGPLGPGDGHVNIQIPVIIDVHHGGAGGPPVRLDACGLCDVLEPHIPPVQVQAARDHVARKENVRQSVVIDIADGHPRAVVHVRVALNIRRVVGGDGVGESDSRLSRGQQFEQWAILTTAST